MNPVGNIDNNVEAKNRAKRSTFKSFKAQLGVDYGTYTIVIFH